MLNMLSIFKKKAAEVTEQAPKVYEKLRHESGLLVKNGQVLRIRGTAYEPDTEKPFGAWGQITLSDGTEFFSSFSLQDYTGKLEEAPYIALMKAMEEAQIGDVDALQKFCRSHMSRNRR